uniref:Secreted protein n=1 Tax=Setaria viridis TaxID=4556 RepID=A0A4U6UCJ8_SETVI|nr:hypothetical protein SEVIR_6G006450v2 [Setaria viridis]TKW08098.1 hypothetical protein SEVIR_6G006450v2 [Setaria viridis]
MVPSLFLISMALGCLASCQLDAHFLLQLHNCRWPFRSSIGSEFLKLATAQLPAPVLAGRSIFHMWKYLFFDQGRSGGTVESEQRGGGGTAWWRWPGGAARHWRRSGVGTEARRGGGQGRRR